MKKLIAAIMTALLILCPVSAYAAQTHISYVPGSAKMEVYGNYQKVKDYYEITLGVPGLDTVQLPGGVTLSGSNENEADTNMRIIIVPVTVSDEPAAHKWLTGNLPKADKNSIPYYLGFYDDNDKHVKPAGDVTITLTMQKGYEDTKLYYMDTNGHLKQLRYSKISGTASFTIGSTGYYLFLKQSGNNNTPNPAKPDGNNTTPTNSNSPKTGDSSNLSLWFTLFASSCCTLAAALALILKRKRKQS